MKANKDLLEFYRIPQDRYVGMHVEGVRVVCSHEGQQYVEAVPESEAEIFSVYLVKEDQSMVTVADFYSMEGAKEFRDLIRAMFNGEIK